MSPSIEWLKQRIQRHRLTKRFPAAVLYPGVTVDMESALGRHVVLFRDVTLLGSTVGAYSYVQASSVLYNTEAGAFCSIAGNVIIGLAMHPTTMVSTSPVFYDNEQPLPRFFTHTRHFTENLPRTVVGADVWIGQGAMIKAGVKIGVGAVIGAGAVVTKDVAPYTITGGNPARPIRLRFPDNICQRLIYSRWWEFSDDKLVRLAPLFVNPELLLAELEQADD